MVDIKRGFVPIYSLNPAWCWAERDREPYRTLLREPGWLGNRLGFWRADPAEAYAITHLASGLKVVEVATLEQAKAFLAQFDDRFPATGTPGQDADWSTPAERDAVRTAVYEFVDALKGNL